MTLGRARRSGRVITFGVQKVEAMREEAVRRLSGAGIEVPPVPGRAGERLSHEDLFRMLGYDAVESLDYFDAEGPTHLHDLNQPVPATLHKRFDLVYDGGTTEHCFSAAECLSNAVRLSRPGGRVIHHLPMNNWVDHGFYQFSPGLFFDFYEANGFEELRMLIHFSRRRRESFISYDPRIDGSLPYRLGGSDHVLAFFSARNARTTDDIVFPIQGRYRRAFGTAAERSSVAHTLRGLPRLWRSLMKRTVRLRARRC